MTDVPEEFLIALFVGSEARQSRDNSKKLAERASVSRPRNLAAERQSWVSSGADLTITLPICRRWSVDYLSLMDLPSDLRSTLMATALVMAEARDPWWIITGAAAAMHGASPKDVADVDVLLSVPDAERLLAMLGLPPRRGLPSRQFRSAFFATWVAAPLPVDFMANFCVFDGAVWRKVEPETRLSVSVGEHQVFVPARSELIRLLWKFGRPKDRARARLLECKE